jgi:hypothetical protein
MPRRGFRLRTGIRTGRTVGYYGWRHGRPRVGPTDGLLLESTVGDDDFIELESSDGDDFLLKESAA